MSVQATLDALVELITLLQSYGRDCTLESLPADKRERIGSLIICARLAPPLPTTVGSLLDMVYALKEKLTQNLVAVPPEATMPSTKAENSLRSKILDKRPKVSSQLDDAAQKSPEPGTSGPC